MGLSASDESLRVLTGPRDAAMRKARVCYNHLAGNKGIQLYDSLITSRHLLMKDGTLMLSRKGQRFITDFGIDLDALLNKRTPLCRSCLDWSERRTHLAGSLGRALLVQFEDMKWVKREPDSRVLKFTARGERHFDTMFT